MECADRCTALRVCHMRSGYTVHPRFSAAKKLSTAASSQQRPFIVMRFRPPY
jgi:hypothetical protein